ncbi:MAG: N-acetylmuramoyl-L-alanine amidase [Rhodocyclaceae bacterium]|nr:N-acetylmuramoyl-L-alanine amidase [Rhodocyclaceae bacterium]
MTRTVLCILLTALLSACAPTRRGSALADTWIASPNHGPREPNLVVLHYTTNDDAETAIRTLIDPRREVSAHYLIGRDGRIYQLVDELRRAWHAGAAYWGGMRDINSASIGIELDNSGHEPFPPDQIEALLALLADLQTRYDIPTANFIGHSDVALGRKVDPGVLFPWRTLAAQGFGRWCDPPYPAVPPEFSLDTALHALGYDTADPDAARRAFRLHYLAEFDELGAAALEADLAHCLLHRTCIASDPANAGRCRKPEPGQIRQ